MIMSLKQNWKVYTMEAVCLGIFMTSASFFGTLLEAPNSFVHQQLPNGFVRLCLMAFAMGITAMLINYSPMGKLSGAHMNPAVSFTFFRLGKMKMNDAIFYAVFQIAGGVIAVWLMAIVLGNAFRDAPVSYVITMPGKSGEWVAFFTETVIAFLMMTMVLITSSHSSFSKYTGMIAGFFVVCYVIIIAPISGFSMNPARTLASDIPAMQYPSLWIYLTAPFIGMLGAAEVFVSRKGKAICAKMYHSKSYLCIFNCGYCEHKHEE